MSELALVLDGSTHSPTIALLRGGTLVAEAVVSEKKEKSGGRGEALVPLIAELLADNGVAPRDLQTIICGAGPGSFTSLRVAASVAKGVTYAAKAKMFAVSSLLLCVAGADGLEDGEYLAVLPAMRGELFALPVLVERGFPSPLSKGYAIIAEGDARATAGSSRRLIGPGQEVDSPPHARGAARLYQSVIASGPVNLDGWEPDYGRLAEAQVKWEAAHGRPLKT